MKDGLITVAKKGLEITNKEVDALVDEISLIYPEGYAEYCAGCFCAMQEWMKMFK